MDKNLIRFDNGMFMLGTEETLYAFSVMKTGHLEHLYYGRRIGTDGELYGALRHKYALMNGCTISYGEADLSLDMSDICLELSGSGKGDYRNPFIEVVMENGGRTTDFIYVSHEIREGKTELVTLPSAYDAACAAGTLIIKMKEAQGELELELSYGVFPQCNCITRSAVLINKGEKPVTVNRLMSLQLDLEGGEYTLTSFHGSWTREMSRYDAAIQAGCLVNSSRTGFSSNISNPFIMLQKKNCSEEYGECLACNLIYSGNHYEAFESDGLTRLRLSVGINPEAFSWKLNPGEQFETPEAVLTYTDNGYSGISRNMHSFVREHIVRGYWKDKERPVLLNSWEAAYFKFNESKLLKLAKAGKEAGIELFVMDDGWFGKRDQDNCSLGDWTADTNKLPHGIKGIADKVNALGMDFGIWVEPEMINEDSELYRQHPDWAVRLEGREHSLGRNQMLMDLTREEVQNNIIEQMTAVFSSGNISYVKWDMNRNFTDFYTPSLSADRQGEFAHRYILGVYKVMRTLTERFPKILFEGCASGGNRFDLGILCYMPQIWASDNTDAISRTAIQNGYSFGYPQSVIGAHVSGSPNHQTLRKTPLETRFNVAVFGILGYECNLAELDNEELEEIKEQVSIYKKWRKVFQYGDLYRIGGKLNGEKTQLIKWMVVSKDKSKAAAIMVQDMVTPNNPNAAFITRGLDDQKQYHFYNRDMKVDIMRFGNLINTISPVHIKENSMLHQVISRYMKLDGEGEDYTISGSALNYAGIRLKQGFSGAGYNKEIRLYQDYDSRMYFMEEVK